MHKFATLLLLVIVTLAQRIDISIHQRIWEEQQEIKERQLEEDLTSRVVINLSGSNVSIPIPEEHYFRQKVDHFGEMQGVNGTWFNQYFLLVDDYYKPGGPVFLFIGGEAAIKTVEMQRGLPLELAQQYNGLLLHLEHRFYGSEVNGRSVPTADVNLPSLSLCTSQQAIEDLAYFVQSFPSQYRKYNLTRETKWISIGGSYPGALSAWLRQKYPNLIYAAHASSAPVLALENFWRYSYAVGEAFDYFSGSKSCMNGWTRAIQAMDQKMADINTYQNMLSFQSNFFSEPLSQLMYPADFASQVSMMIATTAQYGPNYQTFTLPNGNKTRMLNALCDGKLFPAFTNRNATSAILLSSLQNLTKVYYASKESNSRKRRRDGQVAGSWHFWWYQICNEFGYWQVAQPLDDPSQLLQSYSVYSQEITVDYFRLVCQTMKYPSPPKIDATNQYYGGVTDKTPRIMYVNGRYDPWHWLSILGKAPDPKTQQSILYDGATHCSDFRGRASATTAASFAVFDQIYATYDSWLVVPTPIETTGIVNVTVPTAEYKVPVGVIAGGSAAGAFVLGVVILVIFRQRRTSVPIASKALKLEDGKSDETPKKTAVVTDL